MRHRCILITSLQNYSLEKSTSGVEWLALNYNKRKSAICNQSMFKKKRLKLNRLDITVPNRLRWKRENEKRWKSNHQSRSRRRKKNRVKDFNLRKTKPRGSFDCFCVGSVGQWLLSRRSSGPSVPTTKLPLPKASIVIWVWWHLIEEGKRWLKLLAKIFKSEIFSSFSLLL